MTSTASLLSAGEILKQDSLGRVRTPVAKRQEILAAFDGAGMSAARFAGMVGINLNSAVEGANLNESKRGRALILDICSI
jgi:hypothetical protein